MCGIFGAVGKLPEGALDAVSRAIAHRGPDAEGRFERHDELAVALLHRRLAIIDLSAAAIQPMSNEDQSIWVTFNGEIYNHHALRAELEPLGHTFKSRSDTEVIVHGYEAWGDEVVERLDGMFAFALWDANRKRLLVARDRSGKKPLYFSDHAGCFRFGSTILAIHASGLEPAIDPTRLPLYLSYGFVPAPWTLHAHVEQLLPGHLLVRERDGQIQTRSYWEPRFSDAVAPPPFEEAAKKVRSLVERAVERRLESDVPLGAFLSGGIDSTIIVGVAARALGKPVKTFSIGFSGDPRYDETHFARIAANAFSTEHTEFTLEPSSFDLVEKLVWHHDAPFGDASAIPTYVVSGLTRKHVTVALTGDGGDEVFCGYERFLAAEAAEHIPLSLRHAARALAGKLPGAPDSRSVWSKAMRFFHSSQLPLADRVARFNTYFQDPYQMIRPELRAQIESGPDPIEWQRQIFALGRARSPLKRILEHNFRTYLPYDLLIKADRTSMAHGLELRAPFLDTALIEFASGLPDDYLRRRRQTKRILKHAFRDLLPAEILHRGKMGFGVPLGTWFRGGLRNYLHDRLTGDAKISDYLDRDAVAKLLSEHERGIADHALRLWTLLTLEVWLRSLPAGSIACAA